MASEDGLAGVAGVLREVMVGEVMVMVVMVGEVVMMMVMMVGEEEEVVAVTHLRVVGTDPLKKLMLSANRLAVPPS